MYNIRLPVMIEMIFVRVLKIENLFEIREGT